MADDYASKDIPAWLVKHQRRVERAAARLLDLDSLADVLEADNIVLQGFAVRIGAGAGQSVLITVRALWHDGTPMVLFVGAESVVLALAKMLVEVRKDEAKWKVDEYRTKS